MRKNTVLLLIVAMLLSLAGCASPAATTPAPTVAASANATADAAKTSSPALDYLNMEGYKPIVKEGTDVTLKVFSSLKESPACGDPNEAWLKAYIEKALNVKLVIESVNDSALTEKKGLLFASQELPDIFWNAELSTLEQVKYGQVEGQLLKLNDLIDKHMPTLTGKLKADPYILANISCQDGSIYALPSIDETTWGFRIFVKKTWLDAAGLKLPQSLDDFYNMLLAFKQKDPGGVGADKVLPLGGGISADRPITYIYNALGYMGTGLESNPMLRNGEVDILAGNKEMLKVYLQFLNKLYTQGLIDKDFYTVDSTEARGLFAEGAVGVYAYPAYVITPAKEDFQQWISLEPLTSAYNDTKAWPTSYGVATGSCAVSASCKYPEVAVRLFDYFYTDEGYVYGWNGPSDKETDLNYGLVKGWTIDDKGTLTMPEIAEGKYESAYAYKFGEILISSNNFCWDQRDYMNKLRVHYGMDAVKRTYDQTNGDDYYRYTLSVGVQPYLADTFPGNLFFSVEDSTRANELKTVITEFTSSEIAKFVTGSKSIDTELDVYFNELSALGFDEYKQLYTKAYAAYKASLGK